MKKFDQTINDPTVIPAGTAPSMDIPTEEFTEDKPKKNPMKKVTKVIKKTGKKIVKTTGKIAITTVEIVTLPITLPLGLAFTCGVIVGAKYGDDDLDD